MSAAHPATARRRGGGALPSLSEVRSAASDTLLLVRLRWRFVRTARHKVALGVGFGLFVAALAMASQIGTLIRHYAEQGVSTAAGQFAVNYVIALNRGELGALGATAIGSVIVIALLSPLTGSAMQALAAGEDLAGLRPARLHRYFDSLATSAASSIGALQLLTLTGLGSLLTLDGGRAGGMVFMWSIWPAVTLLSVAQGWLQEWLSRKYGLRARTALRAGIVAVIGVAVLLDPAHGRTLFGLGTLIAATPRASAAGNTGAVLVACAAALAVAVVLLVVGLLTCRAALTYPALATRGQQTRLGTRKLPPFNPDALLRRILFRQVLRTPEVRRPLVTILLLGTPAVWLADQEQAMSTLVLAIPLAVALAFGINIFGVIGPAMTWMASQPHLMSRLLGHAALLHVALTGVVAVLIWGPAILGGRIALDAVPALAAGTLVSTLVTVRSSAHKSVHRPHLTRLGTRGDMIVPPLTAINYTFRFAVVGQIGVIVMSLHGATQMGVTVMVVLWTWLRFSRLSRHWRRRDVQTHVIKCVAAA